jgi:hypothetical protein
MLINLAQTKILLQIASTDTTKDALITALIPEAEAKYLQIRNKPFLQFSGDLTNTDKTVSNVAAYPVPDDIDVYSDEDFINYNLSVQSYIFNSANSIDNYITAIDAENNTLEIDTAASTTASTVIFTAYPLGSKLTAAKLIQYFMSTSSMNGLKSESIGSYSYTKSGDGQTAGVPDDIYRSIKRYIGSKP